MQSSVKYFYYGIIIYTITLKIFHNTVSELRNHLLTLYIKIGIIQEMKELGTKIKACRLVKSEEPFEHPELVVKIALRFRDAREKGYTIFICNDETKFDTLAKSIISLYKELIGGITIKRSKHPKENEYDVFLV